uniref:Uncharacterized protein n=1 Tax=Chenopodium quinoa TaxID=63459 RepID=A0A803KZV1_CHEQI
MDVVVMEVEEEEEERENGSEDLKWENIMPRMVLRVLLVEADDSTLAAISDGLKAWEILKRRHNSIDLILTELDLPSISGYALLTLIMEHDDCKNIPVIIMSSQDSISMVLKCLLKGAADFLVKPVRKNELKNLWRHVWKRLANNGGNNPQNLTIGQHKAEAPFENNQAINHSGDNVSSSWRSSDFSEKATDAQCLLQMKHGEETEVSGREDKHQAKDVKLEEGLSLPTNVIDDNTDKLGSNVQLSKEVNVSTSPRVEDGSCAGIATDDGGKGPGNHTYRAKIAGHDLPQPSIEAVDLIGRIKEQEGAAREKSVNGEFNEHNSTPALELSLKRPLNSETKEVHERQILNHSKASAFSWYSSIKKPQTSVPSSGDELPKIKGTTDSLLWPKPCSSDLENKPNILAPQSAICDPVSPHHQIGPVPLPGLAFDSGVWASYGAVFQPIFNPYTRPTARSPNSALQREESPLMTSPSKLSDPGTHSSIQGCGQAGDELKAKESADQSGYNSSQVVDPSGSITQCNDFGNQQNLSAHGSASEITDVNATAPGMKESSLVEETEGCKPLVHDQFKLKMGLHSAEREAALAKFLQKRKNRCFEKKVRYQSRKKLAEQRPRVKGQFVRQVPSDQVVATDKL